MAYVLSYEIVPDDKFVLDLHNVGRVNWLRNVLWTVHAINSGEQSLTPTASILVNDLYVRVPEELYTWPDAVSWVPPDLNVARAAYSRIPLIENSDYIELDASVYDWDVQAWHETNIGQNRVTTHYLIRGRWRYYQGWIKAIPKT